MAPPAPSEMLREFHWLPVAVQRTTPPVAHWTAPEAFTLWAWTYKCYKSSHVTMAPPAPSETILGEY